MTDVFTVIVEMVYVLRCVGLFVSSSPLQSRKININTLYKGGFSISCLRNNFGWKANEIKEGLRVFMEYWVSLKT